MSRFWRNTMGDLEPEVFPLAFFEISIKIWYKRNNTWKTNTIEP